MLRDSCFAAVLAIAFIPCARAEPLLLCGAGTVFEIDTARAAEGKIERAWIWDAGQREELPEAVRGTFATTDDCKAVNGGSRVLISSSSGGCALVDRPSGKVVWYARVPNAHSLELLPRARVVVASSTHAKGNRLVVFDLKDSDRPVWDTPLPSAHGVVWDEKRQLLWALGLTELRCYELKDWQTGKPSLGLKEAYLLPDEDGHDLQPVPGTSNLIVTTGRHVYRFDRDEHVFRPDPALGDRAAVKSVSVHPATGQTVFIQATESWWSDTLGLLSPSGWTQLPGERLYKARWLGEDRREKSSEEQ